MRLIKDAIHNSIGLSDAELALADLPALQRLRGVRQLSTAHLVYPSATHTRFEHSLGTMHLTGVLAERLGFDAEKTAALRAAGLLHDAGHGAFSHVSEAVLKEFTGKGHEERGIALVKGGEISGIIKQAGIDPGRVCSYLAGKEEGAIIACDMGTDRIDYLLRDAHFTGVAYSIIDADRLLHTMEYRGGELFIQERGLLAAESLLVSRYFMFKAVYYHPTVRIAGEMAAQAMRLALRDKVIEVGEITSISDEGLITLLGGRGSALAKRLAERRLLKTVFCGEVQVEGERQAREVKKDISDFFSKAGFGEDEVAVCLPETHTKPFSSRVMTDGGPVSLDDASNLVRALEAERREKNLIIAVPKEKRALGEKKAAEWAKKAMGG